MRCRIGLQGNYVITVEEGQKAAQKDKGSRDGCYQREAAHCGTQKVMWRRKSWAQSDGLS